MATIHMKLNFRVKAGERLGALGMEEVRRHTWFKSLNWKGGQNDHDAMVILMVTGDKVKMRKQNPSTTAPFNAYAVSICRIKTATLEAAFSTRYQVISHRKAEAGKLPR